MEKPILVIGYGKMGKALVDGWCESKSFSNNQEIIIVDSKFKSISQEKNISFLPSLDSLKKYSDNFEIILLAVKPQTIDLILPELKHFQNSLFISILAGKEIDFFEKELSKESAIVRAMPNTPASIGKGITALVASSSVTKLQREKTDIFFRSSGDIVWLDDEEKMSAVTAVSGSSPAYFFAMVEALTEAGIKEGLSRDISEKLAQKTFIGSAYLLEHSNKKPAQLRHDVTSPKGTTEAALKVFMNPHSGILDLLEKTVKSVIIRAKELL